jgi:hypothetical protein
MWIITWNVLIIIYREYFRLISTVPSKTELKLWIYPYHTWNYNFVRPYSFVFCDLIYGSCNVPVGYRRGSEVLPRKSLHFWSSRTAFLRRFLEQIRERIESKLTVLYKNGYHFTKITTFLRKVFLKITKFKLEFYLIFSRVSQLGGGYTPRSPRPWFWHYT